MTGIDIHDIKEIKVSKATKLLRENGTAFYTVDLEITAEGGRPTRIVFFADKPESLKFIKI